MNMNEIQTTSPEDSELPGLDSPSEITSNNAPSVVDSRQDATLSHSPYPPGEKTQWLFACETHKYIREFINSADQKAQWYIAFASAFLAWLNTSVLTDFWSKNLKEWQFFDILSVVSIIGLSICVISSLITILPRLKGSKKGIVFFGSIAEYETSNDYLADVLKKTDQEIIIEKLKHTHELAKICSEKFSNLKIAVWSGGIGLASAIWIILFQ